MQSTKLNVKDIGNELHFRLIKSSYNRDDVVILLKDVSGSIQAQSTEEREAAIQSGTHYSEMLPLEYKPTEKYIEVYEELLEKTKNDIAKYTMILGDKLIQTHGKKFVIVSLARAGIPIGILVKRYLKMSYHVDIPHYSISIIRGKGIDVNAMEYIREIHPDIGVEHFQFLDGWTGKGAIKHQLEDAVNQLNNESTGWEELSSSLAVLADPAHISEIYGTLKDIIIPSSCLNSTVSGLVSRTILRDDLIDTESGDFHGAVYFDNMEEEDRSSEFIDTITSEIKASIGKTLLYSGGIQGEPGINIVRQIAKKYDINDINKIKPGIGETTRVLLRRIPWCVIINEADKDSRDLTHIIRLCSEKNINIVYDNIGGYKACGIIKDLSADA